MAIEVKLHSTPMDFNSYPHHPRLKEVRDRIEELGVIDLRLADVELLKERLSLLMHGYSTVLHTFNTGHIFYRGRILSAPPSDAKDIGPPPEHLLAHYGRLNSPAKSVVYTNLAAGSIFKEIRAEPGQTVALASYRAKRPIVAIPAGFNVAALKARNWIRKLPRWAHSPEGRLGLSFNRLASEFLAHQFLKDVSEHEDHLYKLSVAWADLVFSAPTVDAIAYPSVANLATSDNVAFKPQSFKDMLELIRVDFVRVEDTYGIHTSMTFLQTVFQIASDGSLSFRPSSPLKILKNMSAHPNLSLQLDNLRWTVTAPNGDLIATEELENYVRLHVRSVASTPFRLQKTKHS